MRNISEIIGPFTWGLHSSPLARCLSYELFGDHWAHLLCHLFISFNFFWVHRAVKGKRQQLRLGVHFEEVRLQSGVHHDVEPCHRQESPTLPKIDHQPYWVGQLLVIIKALPEAQWTTVLSTFPHKALYVKEAELGWTTFIKFTSYKWISWSLIPNTFCCSIFTLQIRPLGSNI